MQAAFGHETALAPTPAPAPARTAIGVTVTVWGWPDARMDLESDLLQRVRDIVAEGFFYGSEIEDLEEDVLRNTSEAFIAADLAPVSAGEFQLVLVPAGIPFG